MNQIFGFKYRFIISKFETCFIRNESSNLDNSSEFLSGTHVYG